jgi:hypothetical protein
MKPEDLFNALCDVVIYHYCDVCRKAGSEDSESAKMLVQTGYMDDTDDAAKAYQKYEDMVLEYALDHLPNGFRKRHDYWGAVCVTDYDGENAPKTDTLYAGDAIGKIMLFDNFAALEAYTQERCSDVVTAHLTDDTDY